jgi:hypothetical protein
VRRATSLLVCIACFAFGAWATDVTAMGCPDAQISERDLARALPGSSELPPAPLSEGEEPEGDDGDGDAIVDIASVRLSGQRWDPMRAAAAAPVQCQYQGPHSTPPTPPPRS